MKNSTNEDILPVGTIVAYAGESADELMTEGWMECNGKKLDKNEYRELFESIGTAFGQTDDYFYLPQLRGMFLRGVSGDKNDRDPDVNLRFPQADGGNGGNAVGSEQTYGTAPPENSFKTSVPKVGKNQMDKGCNDGVAAYNDGDVEITSYTGGDRESRPDNKYVYFIIKYQTLTSENKTVIPPIGAVIPYAGFDAATISNNWLLCNGSPYNNRGEFKKLFSVIGFAHGGENDDTFLIPNYEGYFLRGVDGSADRDPDKNDRTAPYPNGKGNGHRPGNGGNKIGSVQGWATALPVKESFSTGVPHIPDEDGAKRVPGSAKDYYEFNSESKEVDLTSEGGDDETRPANISVNWYIRYR
jgi:microcystin-dependent protein